MLVNEVCKKCGLTKKAIEYYENQGLICPSVMDNGYRQFSDSDVLRLEKISVLRGLGLSVSDILAFFEKEGVAMLHDALAKKDFEISDLQARQKLMEHLAQNQDWNHIRDELDQLKKKQSVLKRLLDKFPGYYGKYISLHFAPFLNEPITTAEQQEAFETIITFLDGLEITIPEDLQEYLDEATRNIDSTIVKNASDSLNAVIENPEKYLQDNKEMLEQYKAITASEEYKATPAYRLQVLLKRLNSENGYNDVFVPAMLRLSKSYREYYTALTKANDIFLEHYQSQPE